MKILFLNLAGPYETATDKTITGLQSKYSGRDNWWTTFWYGASEVLRIDLQAAYQEAYDYLSSPKVSMGTGTPKFDKAKRRIDSFLDDNEVDKIMLSVHGEVDDVDYGICKTTLDSRIKISYLRLYDFFMMLVEDRYRIKPLKLTLVMCYGARSADYTKSHAAEKLGKPGGPDLTTSYAFKLYSLLCKQMNVKMTARTGALSFDEKTGTSKVESELLISAKLTERNLAAQAQPQDPGVMELYDLDVEGVADVLDDIFALKQVEVERIESLGISPVRKRVLKTTVAKARVEKLKEAESKSKYGKLVFEYSKVSRLVTVFVKYDSQKNTIRRQVARKRI